MVGETIATLISSEIKCFFFQFPTYNERRLVLAKYLRISKKRKRKKEKNTKMFGKQQWKHVLGSVFSDYIYDMSCLMVKCMLGEITYYMASWLLLN
jgi:hypothetical protein